MYVYIYITYIHTYIYILPPQYDMFKTSESKHRHSHANKHSHIHTCKHTIRIAPVYQEASALVVLTRHNQTLCMYVWLDHTCTTLMSRMHRYTRVCFLFILMYVITLARLLIEKIHGCRRTDWLFQAAGCQARTCVGRASGRH